MPEGDESGVPKVAAAEAGDVTRFAASWAGRPWRDEATTGTATATASASRDVVTSRRRRGLTRT
ncbi:MAG TPA: hypothetical protein VHN18_08495 [Micromonosporaceae bacterium]|nr:hypothetical protein [Micromonosporaceae bacterium]